MDQGVPIHLDAAVNALTIFCLTEAEVRRNNNAEFLSAIRVCQNTCMCFGGPLREGNNWLGWQNTINVPFARVDGP